MGGKQILQVTVEQVFRLDAAECWHQAYTFILAQPNRRGTLSQDGRPLPIQETLSTNATTRPNPEATNSRVPR